MLIENKICDSENNLVKPEISGLKNLFFIKIDGGLGGDVSCVLGTRTPALNFEKSPNFDNRIL